MRHKEGQWLQQAQNGNAEAFSEVVKLYQHPVYNLCYRMLGNAQEAEDAAQETFLRAFKAIRRYDGERNFASWLLSIAANYCIDQHRRRRFVTLALEQAPSGELVERKADVEGHIVSKQTGDEVQVLLAQLKPKDRAAVVLHYWYEHSYKEIAVELKLSESAVKSRLHRARRTLAQAWPNRSAEVIPDERRQHETAKI